MGRVRSRQTERDTHCQLEAALAAGPVLPALRRVLAAPTTLTGVTSSAVADRGCLVGNTTAELVPADEMVRAVVAAAYDATVGVLAAALERGQAEGEITTAMTPQAQAQMVLMVLMVLQGSALVSRAHTDRDRWHAGIDAALQALRAP